MHIEERLLKAILPEPGQKYNKTAFLVTFVFDLTRMASTFVPSYTARILLQPVITAFTFRPVLALP